VRNIEVKSFEHLQLLNSDSSVVIHAEGLVFWTVPLPNVVKINIDAVFNGNGAR
jgi:hypothetical protein